MATVQIPAHRDGATVEVYEPRQHPSQEEVILDRFELLPGESRDYELRSATAGFRYLPLGDETRRQLREKTEEPTPVGAGGAPNPDGILPLEEMDAGRSRQQELAQMEKKREQAARKGKAPEPADRRGKEETKTGKAAQQQFAEGVEEGGEVKRGSDEPHPGTPDELGQPVGSPAAHITMHDPMTDAGPERTAATQPQVRSEPDQAKVQQDQKRETASKKQASKKSKK